MKHVLIGLFYILTLTLCYLVTSPTQTAYRIQRSSKAAGQIHLIPPDLGTEKWARLANFSRAAPFDAASLQSGANGGDEGSGRIGGARLNFFQRMGVS